MAKRIDTVQQCIAALGGPDKAAKFMRVGPTQISNMKKDGYITSAHHMRVYFFLESRGYDINTLNVFGIDRSGMIPDSGAIEQQPETAALNN